MSRLPKTWKTISLILLTPFLGGLPALAETPPETYQLENHHPLQPALVKITRITVIGSQFEDAIRLSLFTQAGQETTPEALEKDRQRILSLGWFADITPRLIPQGGGRYELLIYAKDNPLLTGVELDGEATLISSEDILKPFQTLAGHVLNLADLRQAKEKLETDLRQAGYSLAHLELVLQEQELLDSKGILHLRLHPGLIENLRVTGNDRTQEKVILRELSLKPGQVFRRQNFEADLARLQRLNYFEDVNLRPEEGYLDSHKTRLVLEVKEKKTADVGFNFGLNNRDGVVGGVHFTDTNLMGEGRNLNIQLQAGLDLTRLFSSNPAQSQRSLSGRIDFFEPWFLESKTGLGVSLFSERTPLFYGLNDSSLGIDLSNGLLQTRTGISLNLGRPLGDAYSPWRGQVALTAEQVGLTDFAGTPQSKLSLSGRHSATDVLFSAGGTLSYDTRDSLLTPHQGIFGSVNAQPVWGDSSWLRMAGNLSTYLPLAEWMTLALGIQGGALLGNHPIYEQFLGTGFSSIRGWQENGSLVGKQYLIGSAEARFPIFAPISGVLFADYGNFFGSQLSSGPWKYGVGAGVRLETPMGLLRLDYGVRDFQALGWTSLLDAGQIHFSLGHKF
jgi:outer membrane protein insertion porin family